MNKGEAITAYLADEELRILKHFVNLADEHKVQNFSWEVGQMTPQGDFVSITHPINIQKGIPAGQDFDNWLSILASLSTLGFVSFKEYEKRRGRNYYEYHVTILPAGIFRVQYETKGPLKQLWKRTIALHKTWMALVGFLISLILAGIRLLEYLAEVTTK